MNDARARSCGSERFASPDRAPCRALEQLILRAPPARDNAVRTAAVGDPQHVRAVGDLVDRGKRIDNRWTSVAEVRRSTFRLVRLHTRVSSRSTRDMACA
jgi:hypothetical protein